MLLRSFLRKEQVTRGVQLILVIRCLVYLLNYFFSYLFLTTLLKMSEFFFVLTLSYYIAFRCPIFILELPHSLLRLLSYLFLPLIAILSRTPCLLRSRPLSQLVVVPSAPVRILTQRCCRSIDIKSRTGLHTLALVAINNLTILNWGYLSEVLPFHPTLKMCYFLQLKVLQRLRGA
jgi:hypothetical protein